MTDTSDGGISLQSVVKRYGRATVLDEISIDIRSGSRVALIGPSGSGKTTVLRCIARLEDIQEGTILVGGVNTGVTSRRREDATVRAAMGRVGMVFQQYNLFPNMTVLDNLTIAPIKVQGMPRAAARELALEMLDQVGLAAKAKALPAQLSGGQQQRVAIARSLTMRPSVLLFDEVTSALDPELVGEVLDVIRRVAAERDVTMLLVTHEMRFARDVADTVVFMEAGKIVETGPPAQVLGEPENARTRQFLRRVLDH